MNRRQWFICFVIAAVYAVLMWQWAAHDHYSEAVMGAFAYYWTSSTCGGGIVVSLACLRASRS